MTIHREVSRVKMTTISSTSSTTGEFDVLAPPEEERIADVERKHQRVNEFLEQNDLQALLLQAPENIAWFTSGTDLCRDFGDSPAAALFITREGRVVITNNVDSPQIFERHLFGLGFQLKERPWEEPRERLISDLCRGRNVAGDGAFPGTVALGQELLRLRFPLTSLDCERLRILGRWVVHAVEATARKIRHNESEAMVAAEVAHRMVKRQVTPTKIQVAADGRSERYRNWTYSDRPLRHSCVISAVGRRWGLHAGVSRTVCFGPLGEKFRDAHRRASMVHATALNFTANGMKFTDLWKRITRIYEKFGCENEWLKAEQGELIGYTPSELSLKSTTPITLRPGMALHWRPSVGPAQLGDTVLITDEDVEWITPLEEWPSLTFEVKGRSIECPAVLRRTEESANHPLDSNMDISRPDILTMVDEDSEKPNFELRDDLLAE